MTDTPGRGDRERSYERFLVSYPEYRSTRRLDELRREEFARLDDRGHIYLDYTGGGLYGESQVRRHMDMLLGRVLANPHSRSPASADTTRMIERCRRRVLDFLNASPDEYAVVFTANASHALKLVGEAYPFQPGDQFLLTFDNHNSVNGIREFDRARGAETIYLPVRPPDMRVDEAELERFLARARPGYHNLFAYPAQSNFSGVQHPLKWVEQAQSEGWDVLLDAAAFVSTNRLDLARWRPDYVALSFYKMFGYPTGVGALIARHVALEKLHRPWFAGGTISVASVQADRFVRAVGAPAFEDGTLDYAGIPAVEIGLDFLDSIGLDMIHRRVRCLTGWLIDNLLALRHRNGRRLIRLYGPDGTEGRGGTVTMNFFSPDGAVIDHDLVEDRSSERGISLRTGCFCNPGAGEMALGLSRDQLVSCFDRSPDALSYEDFRECVHAEGTGAVRVSVGLATNFADISAFIDFAGEFANTAH